MDCWICRREIEEETEISFKADKWETNAEDACLCPTCFCIIKKIAENVKDNKYFQKISREEMK